MLPSSRGRGVLLGEGLAENLGAGMGRKVVYTLTDKHGEIVSGLARVSGIIRTGAPSMDAGLSLLPIDTVRDLLGYGPEEATLVAVFVDDHRESPAVAARLGELVESQAITWDRANPELAGFISMKTWGTRFFEILVINRRQPVRGGRGLPPLHERIPFLPRRATALSRMRRLSLRGGRAADSRWVPRPPGGLRVQRIPGDDAQPESAAGWDLRDSGHVGLSLSLTPSHEGLPRR